MTSRTRGLFGGTFDPPHLGHVAAARAAIDALSLDELVVTVAGDPQLKPTAPVAPGDVRLAMTVAAFSTVSRVVVSDAELRRGGPTYTIDTVAALLDDDSHATVVLVVGADAAAGLGAWHRASELAALVRVAIVPRPGATVVAPEGFSVIDVVMPPVDLSSTQVRAALARGEDPHGLVPDAVIPVLLASRRYSP